MWKTSLGTLVLSLTLLCYAVSGAAEVTGNKWRDLPPSAQLAYVLGVLDAWQVMGPVLAAVAPTEETAARVFSSIANCAGDKGMTGGQIETIVKEYVNENPAEWPDRMAVLVWSAMTAACK